MTFDADRLYRLLPAVNRLRDAAQDGQPGPLRSLLELIARETRVLEDNLDQLYDDSSSKPAPSGRPYLGDLLGVRGFML